MGGNRDEDDSGRQRRRHHHHGQQPMHYHHVPHAPHVPNPPQPDSNTWTQPWGDEPSYSPSHDQRRSLHMPEGMTPRTTTQGAFSPAAGLRREATMPPSTIHVARSSTLPHRRTSDPRPHGPGSARVHTDPRYSVGHGGGGGGGGATAYEPRRRDRRLPSLTVSEGPGARYASPTPISSTGSEESDAEDSSEDDDNTDSDEDEEEEADDEASLSRSRGRPHLESSMEMPSEDIWNRPSRKQRSPSTSSDEEDSSRPVSPADGGARLSRRAIEGTPQPRMIEAPPFRRESAATPSPRTSRSRVSSRVPDPRPPVSAKRRSKRGEAVIHNESSTRKKREKSPSHRPLTRSSSNRRSTSTLDHRRSNSALGNGPVPSHAKGHKTSPEKAGKDKLVIKSVECVACMENKPSQRAPRLKCGHRMCHSCLKRSFELSIKDPQHMPPRCCTEDTISLKHVDALFDDAFKKLWNRKSAEYRTKNRLYCPSRRCGEWIKPSLIKRDGHRPSARCDSCNTKVCVSCNSKWHQSPDCPKDEETQKFLKQAKEEGWKRCYSCKAMVERGQGCNHMTCRCGAQFCMMCGVKWRNCDCEWFNFQETDQPAPYPYAGFGERPRGGDVFEGDGPPVPRLARGHTEPLRRADWPYAPAYEEESRHHRRVQEQQDEDLARRLQYEMSLDGDDSDHIYNSPEEAGDGLGIGLGISSARTTVSNHEHRRRGSGRRNAMPPPAPEPPMGRSYEEDRKLDDRRLPSPVPDPPMGRSYERERTYPSTASGRYDRGSYVTEVHRARGSKGESRGERSRSMERRLADRLSENRYNIPARPDMPLGPPPHMSPQHHMPSHMAPPPPLPPMGNPHYAPMPMPMSMPPTSRGPMMMAPMPPSSFRSQPYVPSYGPPPPDFLGEQGPFGSPDLEGRRRRDSDSVPRSSTLAGLDGPGGVGRVYEWRTFVEPTYEDADSVHS